MLKNYTYAGFHLNLINLSSPFECSLTGLTVLCAGRNDKGQLGVGDCERRDTPTTPTELEDYNIVTAATGRNHTLFVTGRS
jgi:alpha-tubulin suppressor-like RCC1 family protein